MNSFLSWISPIWKYRFSLRKYSDIALARQICRHESARIGTLSQFAQDIGTETSAGKLANELITKVDMELVELRAEMRRRSYVEKNKEVTSLHSF